MEKLYTVNSSKVFNETIGNDTEHHFKGFEFNDIYVFGEKMHVFFCQNEKGIFVIAGKTRKGPAYRGADPRWHSGKLYYDIYYRKNFKDKEEGNKFYKEVKARKEITK